MNTEDSITQDPLTGDITIQGPTAVALYREMVIASGAALYLNTGIKPNRAYTPTAMRAALDGITGASTRSLKASLKAYVDWREANGHPVQNEQVLRAVGR